MKSLFILCYFVLITFSTYAQNQSVPRWNSIDDSIYTKLLFEHLIYIENSSLFTNIYKTKEICVLEVPFITTELPKSIAEREVTIIKDSQLEKKAREGDFHAVWIGPMFVEGETVKVVISDVIVSKAEPGYQILIVGGSFYSYEFNCSTRKFELKNIKRR